MTIKNFWECSRCNKHFNMDLIPTFVFAGEAIADLDKEVSPAWQFCTDCYSVIEDTLNIPVGATTPNYKKQAADLSKQLRTSQKATAVAKKMLQVAQAQAASIQDRLTAERAEREDANELKRLLRNAEYQASKLEEWNKMVMEINAEQGMRITRLEEQLEQYAEGAASVAG